MPYAEEVLLPKLDLDEKKQCILELEGQVPFCFFIISPLLSHLSHAMIVGNLKLE